MAKVKKSMSQLPSNFDIDFQKCRKKIQIVQKQKCEIKKFDEIVVTFCTISSH
jgi:translation elongation factor EF-1beta